MALTHNLGFPRIGVKRELKKALEAYWAGQSTEEELINTGKQLRERHWAIQQAAGNAFVTVGDFAWYDHILEWSTTLGVVPPRFNHPQNTPVDLDTLFRMARGRAPCGRPVAACEMTKWFDTNYHYIVPELHPEQTYRIAREDLFQQVDEALKQGYQVKPVIPGPLTWLWLGKGDAYPGGAADDGKLGLLPQLLAVYEQVLQRLAGQGVEWVQIDEPILGLELPEAWQSSLRDVYRRLSAHGVRLLLATYFEGLDLNLALLPDLPVHGLHIDLVRAPDQLDGVLERLRTDQVLSLGLVDGRNVWRTDLDAAARIAAAARERLGDRMWLAPSCSLLHVPMDPAREGALDAELNTWLACAVQTPEALRLLQ